MNSPRRSALTAGAILLAGMSTACGVLGYHGPIGTVHQGMVSKSTVALGSLAESPVAIVPFDQPDAKLVKVGEPALLSFEAIPGLQVIGTVQVIVPIRSNGDRLPFTPGAVGDDVTEVRGGLTDGQQVRLK